MWGLASFYYDSKHSVDVLTKKIFCMATNIHIYWNTCSTLESQLISLHHQYGLHLKHVFHFGRFDKHAISMCWCTYMKHSWQWMHVLNASFSKFFQLLCSLHSCLPFIHHSQHNIDLRIGLQYILLCQLAHKEHMHVYVCNFYDAYFFSSFMKTVKFV